ncbi:aminotransferase class III-fold pyridoxal phosphate-dependent enzyme [Rathayibacter agropyri]|uniref:aminotransferase class III-fold pyridoxal phosphate-dependent enzyme n=1 Tax=Rathayibacter agropyri TaxID=1634927 RepID=UPI0015661650|nr:aminotransferase class III-fold pyridoxal phosphate-dependent enzyme [Rathayibacter agropyri]
MSAIPALGQTYTFSANPVACAAGIAVLDRIDAALLESVIHRGAEMNAAISTLDTPGLTVRTVGRGLMMGIIVDDGTSAPGNVTARVVRRMRNAGVLALRGGTRGNVIKVTQPLTLSGAEAAYAVDVVGSSLSAEARP